jgi:LacI family transcriptional regulator
MTNAPPTGTRKVTRKDVARYAGVSDAVVSYTLNGGAPVAAATAARVREAVRLLSYTPNASARALKLGSARLIGVIVPDSANPYFAELCKAVEAAAVPAGYAVLVVNSNDTKKRTLEYLHSLASRQVDGVLIAATVDESDVPAFQATGVRWALLNHSSELAEAFTVGVDLEAGARAATEHLISHGYQTIAFIGQARPDDPRYLGWRSALRAAGLEPGPTIYSPFTRPGGHAAGRELTGLRNRPEAVFVSSDMISIGVLRAIHEAGLNAPHDVALASFDGTVESEYSWPPLTTVRQPILAMGVAAVNQLIGRATSTSHQRFEGELVIRRSCGCPG